MVTIPGETVTVKSFCEDATCTAMSTLCVSEPHVPVTRRVKLPTDAVELAAIPKAAEANPFVVGATCEGIEIVRPVGEPIQVVERTTGEFRPFMKVIMIVVEPLDP